YPDNMIQAIAEEQPDYVIFLGDGEQDLNRTKKRFPGVEFLHVRGNCDLHSAAPLVLKTAIAGKKIFAVHGHHYDVKFDESYSTLRYAAMEADADIVLFGHTHVPYHDKSLGMDVLNPGSVSRIYSPTYGVLEISGGDVTAEIRQMQ
ncbi:MAG: YfcE family phosphodiesterase, partial [Oscillospiraceae bacterium]|nr:YfcE family phosphodiesterase [Oscillospiraceae bacterium]